ncbi:MAG: deoxyribodipyrimidine photo-lyase [Pseudomonadota bacterium]
MSRLHVLLFTHDLRVHDNAALSAACRAAERDGGQVLPLYLFDPALWQTEQASARQFDFLLECLRDLNAALEARGSALQVEIGNPEDVLRDLHRRKGLASLHLHEASPFAHSPHQEIETLCRRAGIPLRVHGQNGITSALELTKDWKQSWRQTMAASRLAPPDKITSPALTPAHWPDAKALSLAPTWLMPAQKGGRAAAIKRLKSEFTTQSDPSGASLVDDLSAHLTYGTVSAREVWQGLQAAYARAAADHNDTAALQYGQQIEALEAWCEASQRRASSPSSGIAPIQDDTALNMARLRAWKNGRCGLPIIDAGMRAILAHGVVDPAYQPVLLDFAVHTLGLTRPSARAHLVSLCTAPDPRLYVELPNRIPQRAARARLQHVVRQSKALDPDGLFIRRYVPELADLPTEHLHAPWDAPVHALIEADIVIGQTYPNPGAEDPNTALPAVLSTPRPATSRPSPLRPVRRTHADPKTGQFSLPF